MGFSGGTYVSSPFDILYMIIRISKLIIYFANFLDCCRNKECLNYWNCCTKENPCSEGEGDCDMHNQCTDGLICGIRNCIGPEHPLNADCCEPGTTTPATTPSRKEGLE